jgi:hypothetical protein
LSPPMLTLTPVTPDAVPDDAPLHRLVAALEQRATLAVMFDQDGAGPGGHALTALALGAALSARIAAGRWGMVEIALRCGARLGDVASAMGLEDDEVTVGFSNALDARVLDGRLDQPEADQLRALVDDGPRPATWDER